MSLIAALPMYDWPETRRQTDMEWERFREFFLRAGIEAPERLVRRNADMPEVPGGIRDGEGAIIAPDPATMPPDEFDLGTLWRHPNLLLAQTCWGPLELGLHSHVEVIGQPSYNGFEGGQGTRYSSAILMRRSNGGAIAPSVDGGATLPLELMRGSRFAYNSRESMSGMIALGRDLQSLGETLRIFPERIETGSHRASIVAVVEGRADVCAVDCRTWQMAQRLEPKAQGLEAVGWTGLREGLPMIASRHLPADVLQTLREILEPKDRV